MPWKEYPMKKMVAVRVIMSLAVPIILLSVMLWLLSSISASEAHAAQFVSVNRAHDAGPPPTYARLLNIGADELISPTFAVYLPLVQREAKPSPCSLSPTLISPADNSSLNTLIPRLNFFDPTEPVSSTMLEIADNPAFDLPIQYTLGNSGMGARQLTLFYNLKPATTYFWRTYDVCSAGKGPTSAVFSFTTASNGVILPAPNLVSPANGTVGVGQETTLTWDAVAGAVGYESYICKKTGGCNIAFLTTITRTVYLNPNTEYVWYVSAYNDYAYGDQSDRWALTTASFSTLQGQNH